MRWSSLLLIILSILVILSAYLIINLNSDVVSFDFLFSDIQISLGVLLISFFLLGFFIFLILELIYFSKKNKDE